jgi:hypothetical protein
MFGSFFFILPKYLPLDNFKSFPILPNLLISLTVLPDFEFVVGDDSLGVDAGVQKLLNSRFQGELNVVFLSHGGGEGAQSVFHYHPRAHVFMC